MENRGRPAPPVGRCSETVFARLIIRQNRRAVKYSRNGGQTARRFCARRGCRGAARPGSAADADDRDRAGVGGLLSLGKAVRRDGVGDHLAFALGVHAEHLRADADAEGAGNAALLVDTRFHKTASFAAVR